MSTLTLFNQNFTNGYINGQSTTSTVWRDVGQGADNAIVKTVLASQVFTNDSTAGTSQAFAIFAPQSKTLTLIGSLAIPDGTTHNKFLQFSLIDNATDVNFFADIELTRAAATPANGVISAQMFDNTGQLAAGTVILTLDAFQAFTLTATGGTITFNIGTLALAGANRGPFTSPTVGALLVEASAHLGPAHDGMVVSDAQLVTITSNASTSTHPYSPPYLILGVI